MIRIFQIDGTAKLILPKDACSYFDFLIYHSFLFFAFFRVFRGHYEA
jgi:hypothetical protein